MKSTSFLIIYLISFSAFAQNWALYPPGQGSYYSTNEPENYKAIKYWSVDSIKNGMNEEFWYINSKLLPEIYQKCYTTGGEFYDLPTSFDSLLYRNDTIFYKVEYEANPFYFLPEATEGESWIVSPERKKDSIKITYEKKEFAEFLGVSDSVKRYSYELIGVNADSTNVDEQSMLLSKHYGLIEYIDFKQLLSPNFSVKNYETIRLAGIENDSLQTGYQLPSFKTFLPYSAGDILLWEEYAAEAFDPNTSLKYHLDTLTEVVQNEDSLYYVYNRTSFNDQNEIFRKQSGLIQSFVFTNFENIVSAKPNLWGVGKGTTSYFYSGQIAPKLYLWNAVNHLIGTDTVIIASTHYFDNAIDTTLCLTESTGVSYRLQLESKRGLVSWSEDYFDERILNFGLIGSKINGIQKGTFEVIVNIEEQKPEQAMQLYPNPANSYINLIYNEFWYNTAYSIADIDGRLRGKGVLSKQSINIADLPQGIYFLNVISEHETFTFKFVKQVF